MTASHYWLMQWLDENEIHSDWEIDQTLNGQPGVEGLIEAIVRAADDIQAGETGYSDSVVLNDSIIAGRKLDLSGRMSCPSYGCMRLRIDSTFKRVWHYFDRIVVEGLPPQRLAREIRITNGENLPDMLTSVRDQARLLLYLREIGAERFVVFAPKSYGTFSPENWMQAARDLGLTAIIDEASNKRRIKEIINKANFDITEVPGGWRIAVKGESFAAPDDNVSLLEIAIPRKTLNRRPKPEEIIHYIIRNYAREMIADVSLSRRLALPLVDTVSLPWISRPYRNDGNSQEDAVVRVGLPVFDGLSTRDFLKLREDERPAFEIFRAELGRAIQSEIARAPSNPPAVIAKSIQNDYLRPGLANIEQRIRSRRSALVRKTAVNLTIGTSAAAIGAIAGMPLLVEGVAALGSAIPLAPIIHKYIDDGEPIKMNKFYFLWQADKQAEHH